MVFIVKCKDCDSQYRVEEFKEGQVEVMDKECNCEAGYTKVEREYTRYIECGCGWWEQMPANEQKHHFQTFNWLGNMDNGEARYVCPKCKSIVKSKTE